MYIKKVDRQNTKRQGSCFIQQLLKGCATRDVCDSLKKIEENIFLK